MGPRHSGKKQEALLKSAPVGVVRVSGPHISAVYLVIPAAELVIPAAHLVIPAQAGIQTALDRL